MLATAYNGDPALMFKHFLKWGLDEDRATIAGWYVGSYKSNPANYDLVTEFGNNLRMYYYHFNQQGYYEGRTG